MFRSITPLRRDDAARIEDPLPRDGMSDQEQPRMGYRFSVTEQYGLTGWVVLAVIVATASSLVAMSTSMKNVGRAPIHRTATQIDKVECTPSGGASGSMEQVAFFDDALREMSLCR